MAQDSVTIDLRANNRQLKSSLGQSESMFKKFGGAVKKVAIVLAAAFAVKKVYDFAKASMSLYEVQEKAEKRIESVVRATGAAAGFTADQMKQMASSLQAVTTVGDETILSVQAVIATFRNIRGDEFKRATELALDMAEVLGTDAKGSAMQLSKALQDPVKGLSMLTRVGITFTDQQKEMIATMLEAGDVAGAQNIILDELSNQMGGAARAAADTFTGRVQQLKNRFGDWQENIVRALIPALEEMVPVMDAVMNGLENTIGPLTKITKLFIKGGAAVWDWIKPALEWLVDAGVAAFTLVQVAIENWSDASRLAMMKWYLGYIKVFETLKHWLLVVIPDLLQWFSRNWYKVWWDLQNAQAHILINMGKNIWNFIVEVKNALTGKGFDFKWTGLLEGFEATLEELPHIAKRKLTSEEQGIAAEIDGMQRRMGQRFMDKYLENQRAMSDFFKPGEKAPDPQDIKFDQNVYNNPYAVSTPKSKTDKTDKTDKTVSAQGKIEGLTSLYQRISEAAGKADDTQIQKDQLEKLGEIAASIKDWAQDKWKQFGSTDVGAIFGTMYDGFMGQFMGPNTAGMENLQAADPAPAFTDGISTSAVDSIVRELQIGNQIASEGFPAVSESARSAGALK